MMVFKTSILCFLIVISLVSSSSSSFAGQYSSSISKLLFFKESLYSEDDRSSTRDNDDVIHERLLRANTKDYGRSDPAPTFVKPRFKLIPN
ncbi:hypothetical protein SSX86_024082 [Deinandra increscens subsp. villosa]|uniref:Uncharacterized protein n=1 Tax=Deinandra increscens subsp. villosa TaxID=3103831 RepID=A0AAP0CH31_9ASTR